MKKINLGKIIDINMLSVKEIVKGMRIFERNKVPLEIKILGIAIYIQFRNQRFISG